MAFSYFALRSSYAFVVSSRALFILSLWAAADFRLAMMRLYFTGFSVFKRSSSASLTALEYCFFFSDDGAAGFFGAATGFFGAATGFFGAATAFFGAATAFVAAGGVVVFVVFVICARFFGGTVGTAMGDFFTASLSPSRFTVASAVRFVFVRGPRITSGTFEAGHVDGGGAASGPRFGTARGDGASFSSVAVEAVAAGGRILVERMGLRRSG